MEALPIIVLVAVGVIAFAVWWFSAKQTIKRALRGAAVVPIGDYPDGGIKRVVGRLVLGTKELTAPMTGRSCAAYEVVVEELRRTGNSSRWCEVAREFETVPFNLEDDTGRAHIDPSGAQLVITDDAHSSSGTFDDPSPVEKAFLERHGESGTGWVFNRGLRYREGVLEPGELVAVLGRGTVSKDGAPAESGDDRAQTSARLLIRSARNIPLYISDDTGVLH